ncbi:hypothetical protein ACI2KR_12705 [Pseudomonas luteola]
MVFHWQAHRVWTDRQWEFATEIDHDRINIDDDPRTLTKLTVAPI